MIHTLLGDIRLFVRHNLRTPATSAVILLTLTFGIGLTTAAFTIVNGAVLRPLAYAEPERLVAVQADFLRARLFGMGLSGPEVAELMRLDHGLRGVGAYGFRGGTTVQTGQQAVQVTAAYVTTSLLRTLAVAPRAGTLFDAETDPTSVLVTDAMWHRAFGADPAVVGRAITVNGEVRTVVGIMPPRFDLADADVDLLLPLSLSELASGGRTNHGYTVVARLADDVSLEAARTRLAAVVRTWLTVLPSSHAPNEAMHPLRLEPLHDVVVGSSAPLLRTLSGGVLMVLLIACVNVANLLLARAERCRHEAGVLLALGAGRARLLARWLVEGVSWTALGTLGGCLLAFALVRLVVALEPAGIPRLGEISLDGRALGFAVVLALLTGVVFGLVPGLRLSGVQPSRILASTGRAAASGAGRQWLRHSLIVVEVALAIVLLSGSGAMLRGFVELVRVDPGFVTDDVWRGQFSLPQRLFQSDAHVQAAVGDLTTRLRQRPGIVDVGLMTGLPPRREPNRSSFGLDGREYTEPGTAPLIDFVQICDAGFFSTLGIPLKDGRLFDGTETRGSEPIAIVNEAFARQYWPGERAVGKRISAGVGSQSRPWMTIVGVVGDMRQRGLHAAPGTEVFVPVAQAETSLGQVPRGLNLIVKAAPNAPDVPAALRDEVRRVAPDSPVLGVRTMDEVMMRSVAQPWFITIILGIFGVGALLLAATGIYSVVSYLVGLRTQELGIRLALGASAARLRWLVLAEYAGVLGLGVAVGLTLTYWSTRLLRQVMTDVPEGDLLALVAATLLLTAGALIAADAPARRASRIDPSIVLRQS